MAILAKKGRAGPQRKRAKKGNVIMRPASPIAVVIVRNGLDGVDSCYIFASPFGDESPIGTKVPTRAIERAATLGLAPADFFRLGIGPSICRRPGSPRARLWRLRD